jgi:drug/metabolite transporter (DMT)-like permease
LLQEVLTIGMLCGGVLSFGGLVYLISSENPAALFAGGVHAGDLLMLMAALAYAPYGILVTRWHFWIAVVAVDVSSGHRCIGLHAAS